MVDPAATGPGQAPAHLVKHVCFRLHGQELAVDIAAVKETLAVRPITRVFLGPPYVAGIMNLRGDIIAVLDLARRLGLPPTPITGTTRVVVCQYPKSVPSPVPGPASGPARAAGPPEPPPPDPDPDAAGAPDDLAAGILVDALTELRTLDMDRIEPPPPTLPEDTAALLRGVSATADGAPLQVLDMARLLELERTRATRREAS